MTAFSLSIKNVTASYGRNVAISDVSLDVARGNIFGLVGLNGAGKTTLIKTVLGLKRYDSGQVSLEGEDSLDAYSRKNVAYLPERFEAPAFLSGREFIDFSLSIYNRRVPEESVRKICDDLHLDYAVLGRRAQTYSKGMRQKLGLMATLLTECPLLILDEPMSGLDPWARIMVKKALLDVRAAGRTVFLSSHILSDLGEMCDQIAVLAEKTVVFKGTPKELCTVGHNSSLENAFLNIIQERRAA